MPPRKTEVNDEKLEEMKHSLNFKSKEVSNVAKPQTLLLGLLGEVYELKKIALEKR